MSNSDNIEATTSTAISTINPGENLVEFLQDDVFNVDKTDHSFLNMLRGNMTSLIENRLLPYVTELFGRYTQEDFHQKMNNMYMHNGRMFIGFNFIADWKKYHKYYWKLFVGTARVNRKFLKFDQESLLHKITTIFYLKGWILHDYEIEGLRQTVHRIYNIMYLGNDL